MNDAVDAPRRGPGRPRNNPGLGALSDDTGIPPAPSRTDHDAELVRPSVRNDFDLSPQLAKDRARAIRESGVLSEDASGIFDLPPSFIESYHGAGWSLEWKREQIAGKVDQIHQNDAMRRGWEPVPPERHPDIIVRKEGMILMCRPKEITDEVFNANQVRARAQVENKELQLTTGENLDQNTVDERTSRPGRIKRTVERIPD